VVIRLCFGAAYQATDLAMVHGTAIIDETVGSNEYVEISKTSLMQTLEYYGKQVKSIHFQ
jgi:hypothetical protein